jgi:hypothetical protein
MSINQWVQFLVGTSTAGITIVIFIYSNFPTKEVTFDLLQRIDKIESRQDRSDEKIERKLELINQKLDNLILNKRN